MKLGGIAQVMDFDPYEQITTDGAQAHNIGERVYDSDRIFRYAIAGEALAAGYLTTEPTGNTSLTNMAVVTGAIGSKVINFTNASTTSTANYYDEGYVCVTFGTGIGQTYKISSMAALVSAANSNVYLNDPIKVALDTTSRIDIVPNPWNRVLHTAIITPLSTGVPLIAVTALGDYCWLQTRGVCAVFSDNTVAAGSRVMEDGSVAGAVDIVAEANFITTPVVGTAYHIAGVQNYAHPIFLTID